MSKSLSNDSRYYFGPSALIKKRVLLLKSSSANEWDFSVREDFSSRRLFVSTVVWSSDSYSKGLRPNDQILSINGIPVDQFNSFNEILNVRSIDAKIVSSVHRWIVFL